MAQAHVHHIQRPEGADRWICVYPAYINKQRTVAEGRRIPKDKAVENPFAQEIMDVLQSTGLQIFGERKVYCREKSKELMNTGMIRVQTKKNGKIINDKFKTRDQVYLYCAQNIPKLKSRTNSANPSQPVSAKPGKSKKKK